MSLPFLLLATAIMLCLGAVTAVLFRVGGLVVMLMCLTVLLAIRWGTGHPLPGLGPVLLLFAALQAGYLIGALTPLADLLRKSRPAPDLSANKRENTD